MEAKFKFKKVTSASTLFSHRLLDAQEAGINGTFSQLIGYALNHRLDVTKPVNVTLKLTQCAQNELPGVNSIYDHVKLSIGKNATTMTQLQKMLLWRKIEQVKTLVVDIDNAGKPEQAVSLPKPVRWHLLAASELNVAYYTQHAINGEHRDNGLVELIGHRNAKNEVLAAKGKLRMDKAKGAELAVFTKDVAGFKVTMPFLRREYDNIDAIVGAIFAQFWLAILKQKLQVTIVNGEEVEVLNEATLGDVVIKHGEYFAIRDHTQAINAARYVAAYKKGTQQAVDFEFNATKHSVTGYVNTEQVVADGLVGIFSATGQHLLDYHAVSADIKNKTMAVVLDDVLSQVVSSSVNRKATKLRRHGALVTAEQHLTFTKQLLAVLNQLLIEYNDQSNSTSGLLMPATVRQMALDANMYADVTKQTLGSHLAELESARTNSTFLGQRKFKVHLMLGGRYSSKVNWDSVGINAWNIQEKPYLMQLPTLDLTTVFPSQQPITIYTREGLRFSACLELNEQQPRLIFTEGDIYDYVRRAIGLPDQTLITMPILKGYGKSALAFEQLTATEYYMEF